MNIFITGVAGFLGSHLADYFLERGHQVSGCDNLMGGYLNNVNKKVKFYNYECNDLNSMLQITKNIDITYHCAASAHEGLSSFSLSISKNTVEHLFRFYGLFLIKSKKLFFAINGSLWRSKFALYRRYES